MSTHDPGSPDMGNRADYWARRMADASDTLSVAERNDFTAWLLASEENELDYRRAVLEACEETMERLASDPHYFANPDKSLFQDIRRYFPITQQAQVAWAVQEGVGAAVAFVQTQIEAGAFDGGVARCRATTRKGKPCQRTPLPERDYCPSHQHLERSKVAA